MRVKIAMCCGVSSENCLDGAVSPSLGESGRPKGTRLRHISHFAFAPAADAIPPMRISNSLRDRRTRKAVSAAICWASFRVDFYRLTEQYDRAVGEQAAKLGLASDVESPYQ